MAKQLDYSIIGKKFGRLLVLDFLITKNKMTKLKCLCDCGKEHFADVGNIRKGTTSSCGCFRREKGKKDRELDKVPLHYKKYGEAALNSFIKSYKESAKDRNLLFTLDREQFIKITSQNCYYCGAEPIEQKSKGNNGGYKGNGIDRKDNLVGYEINNCLPCCKICNRAKLNLKYEEFMEWINRIKNYETPKSLQ